jgi:hypothetical protein
MRSGAAQTVKEVESGKSGADDDDVEFFDLGVVRRFVSVVLIWSNPFEDSRADQLAL